MYLALLSAALLIFLYNGKAGADASLCPVRITDLTSQEEAYVNLNQLLQRWHYSLQWAFPGVEPQLWNAFPQVLLTLLSSRPKLSCSSRLLIFKHVLNLETCFKLSVFIIYASIPGYDFNAEF